MTSTRGKMRLAPKNDIRRCLSRIRRVLRVPPTNTGMQSVTKFWFSLTTSAGAKFFSLRHHWIIRLIFLSDRWSRLTNTNIGICYSTVAESVECTTSIITSAHHHTTVQLLNFHYSSPFHHDNTTTSNITRNSWVCSSLGRCHYTARYRSPLAFPKCRDCGGLVGIGLRRGGSHWHDPLLGVPQETNGGPKIW